MPKTYPSIVLHNYNKDTKDRDLKKTDSLILILLFNKIKTKEEHKRMNHVKKNVTEPSM